MFFVLPKREIPIICRSKATSGSESISISVFGVDSAGAVAGVDVALAEVSGGGAERGVDVPLRGGGEGFSWLLGGAGGPAVAVFGWGRVGLEADGA